MVSFDLEEYEDNSGTPAQRDTDNLNSKTIFLRDYYIPIIV
jgi:hypothetical protein